MKIGRNAPCPCGSGKKYKKCCLLKKSVWMPKGELYIPKNSVSFDTRLDTQGPWKHFVTYVSYKELYKDSEHARNDLDLLRKEISEFNTIEYVLVVAKLHYFFSEIYIGSDNRKELDYAKELLPEIPHNIIEKLWKERRKFFSRQQMLSLMKVAILENGKNSTSIQKQFSTFSRTLLRITDIMDQNTDSGLGYIYRNYLFNLERNPAHCFPRYQLLYTTFMEEAKERYPKEYFPIKEKFFKLTGLDLNFFIFLTFGLLAHYYKPSMKLIDNPLEFIIGEQYFKNLKLDVREKAKNVFLTFSATNNDLRSEIQKEDVSSSGHYYTFPAFWRKPFFKMNDNAYFLLDKRFLQEKATYGIHDTLLDSLIKRKNSAKTDAEKEEINKKINKLQAFVGRCFELYVRSLLKRIYPTPDGMSKRLYCESDGDIAGMTDFIVYYPNTIVLLEVTTSAIKYNTIVSGNTSKMEDEIHEIFFSSDSRKSKGKIYQLDEGISAVRSGNPVELSGPLEKIRIYPLIITEKEFPWFPPTVEHYHTWIKEKGLLTGYVQNFLVLDIEELELIEEILTCSSTTFPELLEEYRTSIHNGWSFKNFLYSRKSSRQNSYLFGVFKDMMNSFCKKYLNEEVPSGN